MFASVGAQDRNHLLRIRHHGGDDLLPFYPPGTQYRERVVVAAGGET
jgi:hypothetical protein